MGCFQGLAFGGKKQDREKGKKKKEEKREVQVRSIIKNIKPAFSISLLYKSCLCLTVCAAPQQKWPILLLYCLNKGSRQLKYLEFISVLCTLGASLIGREVCSAVKQYTPFMYILPVQLLLGNVSNHRHQLYSRLNRSSNPIPPPQSVLGWCFSSWFIKSFYKSHHTCLSFLVPNSPGI